MPGHWFFTSYARADGLYVDKFRLDVARQVLSKEESLRDVEPSDVGYMDRNSTEPGDEWEPALLSALQRAKILVCVLSRRYLASEYCGKEFEIFRRRVAAYTEQLPAGQRPRLIMPVFWHPKARLDRLPEAISRIQFDHSDYGDRYLEKGLYTLSTQTCFDDEYKQFLDAFTWKIVDAVREHPLPPATGGAPLSEAINAFRPAVPRVGEVANDRQETGPRSVRFVFVTPRGHEFGPERKNVAAYGTTSGRDWRPFQPEVSRTVGTLSSGAAAEEDLFPEELPLGADPIEGIRQAERENAIVLLIVDPWSIKVDAYREFLEAYDRETFINSGVIVVWDLNDAETAANETDLRGKLRRAISRTCVLNGHVRDSVSGAEQLRRELIQSVHEIRRRIAAHGDVFENARGDVSQPLPQLAGPGGEP